VGVADALVDSGFEARHSIQAVEIFHVVGDFICNLDHNHVQAIETFHDVKDSAYTPDHHIKVEVALIIFLSRTLLAGKYLARLPPWP